MRILVVGDRMVDRYLFGEVERLNPESHSTPLVRVCKSEKYPGGSGNVVENLLSLGVEHVEHAHGPKSIVKTRVVVDDRVILRYDVGNSQGPTSLERLSAALENADAVVVSDYGKGAVTPGILEKVALTGLPTYVDTKADPERIPRFQKLIANPNISQYHEHAGAYNSMDLCLVKMGRMGIMAVSRGKLLCSCPSLARHVVNVAGAGDTVLAAIVVARMRQLGHLEYVLKFAMAAAAVAVSKIVTYAPTLEEVDRCLLATGGL